MMGLGKDLVRRVRVLVGGRPAFSSALESDQPL